jgi:hypothetical protein
MLTPRMKNWETRLSRYYENYNLFTRLLCEMHAINGSFFNTQRMLQEFPQAYSDSEGIGDLQ